MSIPLCWRKLYCSFRISCHDLEIERGRYIRPRKPPEKRICKLCKMHSETEMHFICDCTQYSDLREDLYKYVEVEDENFMNASSQDKFKYMMTTSNINIIKKVMTYIYSALKLRKEELSKK